MTKRKVSPGLFREISISPRTPFEKTAAAAKLIVETEAHKRADRTAALRAARLARDSGQPVDAGAPDDSAR